MSQLWGFLGRVGYKGNTFLPGGRAAERQGVCSSMPRAFAGPLLGVALTASLLKMRNQRRGLSNPGGLARTGRKMRVCKWWG